MRKLAVRVVLMAFVAVTLGALSPLESTAQYREFVGRIDSLSGDSMRVDNRRGDKMEFKSSGSTSVQGEGRTGWKSLKKNDWVAVSWTMTDKPPIAHRVVVMPPRD